MRLEGAIGHERFADLIANDLQLAQLAVGRMHAQRRIVGREREGTRSFGITIIRTRQLPLQLREQRVVAVARLAERRSGQRHDRGALRHQQALQHLPLTTERCDQRMHGGGHRTIRQQGGIYHDLSVPRDRRQQLDDARRQRAHAEHGDPRRQRQGTQRRRMDMRQQLREPASPMLRAIATQIAPQRRLPALMRRVEPVLATLPRLEQVMAKQLVIVEPRGHLRGKSKAHPVVAVAEIARQRGVAGVTQIHVAQ